MFPALLSQMVVLFADAIIVLTLPLHVRFLHVLLSKKTLVELEGPYYTMLIHYSIHNILFSISNTLILEPALLGIAPQFYKDTWLARTELIKATVLLIVGTVAHFLIALNRFTAVLLPVRHSKMWTSKRVHRVFYVVWALVFLLALPIITDGDHIASRFSLSVFNTTDVEYVFVGSFNDYYQMGCALFGLIMYASTLLCYIIMLYWFRKIRKRSPVRYSSISFTLMLKVALTSFLMTIGGWMIQILITAIIVHVWIYNKSFLSINDFSVLFRLFNALHNVLMPWIMVYNFRTVRARVGIARPKIHLFVSRSRSTV